MALASASMGLSLLPAMLTAHITLKQSCWSGCSGKLKPVVARSQCTAGKDQLGCCLCMEH